MQNSTTYGISDLAKEFGVTLRTLRFYEGRGLISPARHGSQRVYYEADRIRLRKICDWTDQGFTLAEIKAALDAGGFNQAQLAKQLEHLQKQRAVTEKAIAALELLVSA